MKIMTLILIAMILGFSVQAEADLFNRGTDILGNRLIYDSDLEITWYDLTNDANTWQNQVDWAGALTVDFGGTVYDDWLLPTTLNGSDGYNQTNTDMGHLFYTALGNDGYYDTAGVPTGCSDSSPWCQTEIGDFQNLQAHNYWSGTEYAGNTGYAWSFSFKYGGQSRDAKASTFAAMAVRSGDVVVVPEPISSILFLTGGVALGLRRYRKTITN